MNDNIQERTFCVYLSIQSNFWVIKDWPHSVDGTYKNLSVRYFSCPASQLAYHWMRRNAYYALCSDGIKARASLSHQGLRIFLAVFDGPELGSPSFIWLLYEYPSPTYLGPKLLTCLSTPPHPQYNFISSSLCLVELFFHSSRSHFLPPPHLLRPPLQLFSHFSSPIF